MPDNLLHQSNQFSCFFLLGSVFKDAEYYMQLEDIQGLDPEDEGIALELAAAGAIQEKLDTLDGSFLLALDWMIKQADSEHDDKVDFLNEDS